MNTTVRTSNLVLFTSADRLPYEACANLKAFESRQPSFTLHLTMHGAEIRPLLPTFPPQHPTPSHQSQDPQTTLLRKIYPDDGGTNLFRKAGDCLAVDLRRSESYNLLTTAVIAMGRDSGYVLTC